MLLFGDRHVLGLGVVEDIQSWPCDKTLRYCPECGDSNLKRRKTMTPPYRCDRGHVFDEPVERVRPTTCYRARYETSYVELRGVIDRQAIRACELAPTSQGGIRPLDPDRTRALLESVGIDAPG